MSSIGIPSDRPQTYDNVLNLQEKRSRSPGPERAEGVPLHSRPANPPLALHLCYVDNRAERATRIETAMGQHGHTVTTCLRADEALKTLSSSTIDAIILGPSGALSTILLTAIRRAAKSNINALPVVVLSTNETFDNDCELMNYGANLVLPTTITAQQLNTHLSQLFFVDDDSGLSTERRQKICMLESSTLLDSRLRLAIASTNSEVDTYFSVTDIIHSTQEYHYDVIIVSERHINGAPGAKAVQLIRNHLTRRGERVPILALTTNASPANISALFAAGADDVKPQPIYFDLNDHLQSLIRDTKNSESSAQMANVDTLSIPNRSPSSSPQDSTGKSTRAQSTRPSGPFRFPAQSAAPGNSPHFEALPQTDASSGMSSSTFDSNQLSPNEYDPFAPQPLSSFASNTPFAMPTPSGNESSHEHNSPPPFDPFRATHDPLAEFFKRFFSASSRFHGQQA